MGLALLLKTPLVSLERLHVAFDADPKFTAELNPEANLRYLRDKVDKVQSFANLAGSH